MSGHRQRLCCPQRLCWYRQAATCGNVRPNRGIVSILTTWMIVAGLQVTTLPAQSSPRVLDSRMRLQLFASEPDIVTPTGATVDRQGRLLFIESHTHQRPQDYAGPTSDRIRIVEDTDGDGRADRFRTFFEGTQHTMSIRQGADAWVYVATRAQVFRIRDSDGDDRADQQETLVQLNTSGNYPHNGISGLARDNHGHWYFGMGENLGVPWRMVGSDGATQSGSGAGGIFRCDSRGANLTRVATGFWNPFGICVDPHGRVFAVGNDADARPPSRLVQVVETGDYGFQFRYGRSGIHPLQAWDGELPGTLPMVSGTGEAPCELIIHQGRLITGSWGDFRVERYELLPLGASFQARREIVVQGDENFRPVAFAEAPDGSLLFTDWVDKSYPVHGKGRIWRLSWKEPPPATSWPDLSAVEQQAVAAVQQPDYPALQSDDRFLRQFAIAGLVRAAQSSQELRSIDLQEVADPRQRLALLQALRWKTDLGLAEPEPPPLAHLRMALTDEDPDVRLFAVRWIADRQIEELREELKQLSTAGQTMNTRLFLASLAALEYLESGQTSFDPQNTQKFLVDALVNPQTPASVQRLAWQMIDLSREKQLLDEDFLRGLMERSAATEQREAIRSFALATRDLDDGRWYSLLMSLAATEDARHDIQAIMTVQESLTKREGASRPSRDDRQAWMQAVGQGGDANRGWRIFFGKRGLNCAACHALQGRGSAVGPDLTAIASRTSRESVLASILNPAENVAPHYVPVRMTLADGRLLTGLWAGHDEQGRRERFLNDQGGAFFVDPSNIEQRRTSTLSIMPQDLIEQFSVEEIRDLLALLEER